MAFVQWQGQLLTGTTRIFAKGQNSIAGLLLNLSDSADITWHVSDDGDTWYAITPPDGSTTWTGFGTDATAIPVEDLMFLSPYPFARITFSASQTDAVVMMPTLE